MWQTIDEILGATLPGYPPTLWLATEKYHDAPTKLPRPQGRGEGTTPPIPKGFKSPWIGTKIEDLTKWLQAKPEDIDLNSHHFAVLDQGAKDDPPTIVVCRIGGIDFEGDELYVLRKNVVQAIDQLIGAPSDGWTEAVRYRGNSEIWYNRIRAEQAKGRANRQT